MKPVEVARRYASAFNDHDIKTLTSLFTAKGTYLDPVVAITVNADGLGEYASGLIQSFPNLSFDLVSMTQAGDDTVVFEWVMKGKNTGPMPDGPATHRDLSLPGVDVIKVEGDRIASIRAYFDRMAYAEQMGLLPQPEAA